MAWQLRIQCCHCCGSSHFCGTISTSDQRTSAWDGNDKEKKKKTLEQFFLMFFCLLGFIFRFFRAKSVAYGSSQAQGEIGDEAASLRHSHRTSDPTCVWYLHHSSWQCWILTHWVRPEIKPMSSWILVSFITRRATMGTPSSSKKKNQSHPRILHPELILWVAQKSLDSTPIERRL